MINAATLDLITSFEGYHKALPDGSCTAYQEEINGKKDIPTIGWGTTRGVTMGMVWTRAQAEAALRKELEIHERRVETLIATPLNANEFGALVSFDFNAGGLTLEGGKPSKVLKAINAGDRQATAAALREWNHFGGKVCEGLVRRRAAEIALFLTPTETVEPAFMPQSAEPEAPKPLTKSGTMWGSFGTALAGVGVYLEQTFATLVDTASKWSEIGPARDMLANVAGNGKALSLGLLAGCVALIVSRRVKASQEGKPG